MTADYNGWNDAPEAEREAMDVFFSQELEREALAANRRGPQAGSLGRHTLRSPSAHWRMS